MTVLLFPLYIYPADGGEPWLPVVEASEKYPALKMLMVVNPSNGPGTKVDQNYLSAIGKLASAGVPMAGYVYTKYGARPQSEVEADVLSWSQLHPEVKSLFVDNMANKPGFEQYYSAITAYARSLGYTLVVGNPGAAIPRSYSGTVDVAVIYEHGGFPPSLSRLDPYGWYGSSPSSFGMLVHDAPALDVQFLGQAATVCGYVGVTESYHAIPPYFDQLAALLST